MGKECDMFYACKGRTFSEFSHKACHNQNALRNDFKYIPPHSRRDKTNLNSKENKIYNSKQSKVNKKIECYICGENHLARDCNKKYSKLKNEKKETSQVQYVQPKVDLEPLKYVIIYINGKAINCVLDSGTQIFICNSNIFPDNSNDEFGKITLGSAFGENVEAKLIKTSITLDNNSLNHPMDCLVAITDKLNAEALIPPSLYEALCSVNNETNENDIFAESVDSFTPFSNDENDAESGNEIFYVESDSDNLNFNSDYSKMKDEQNNCDSLKKVHAELKLNKGNFLLVEELIYRRDKILNEPVMQLVLPRCRIDKVMKLAHELLYGREVRGPLAILKSSWAGEIHLPTNISQSAADYLQEMKIKMEKAAESASLTAAQKEKSYGDYFNKRSSVKNFSIGEQVVLLIPDSSNKIYARWTGPGEIIQHHPLHSYKVKLSDRTVRHVHVNKIRKYHPRALAVGIIFEDDHEFGEIHPTPNLLRYTSERVLHETDLNHLKETEREQVLAILLKTPYTIHK
ncbi:retrovirus-related Pol polyprotein from transposon 17.6 [Trichonephila clavata]|uniref:Retrovirus-related Pol polyprotein from transposon 17.6 n=1 Tax=Trichonephila clavata TaxID=2740835 RepID=A0A8X6KSQ8_TRICU|nr:retrovirus-related Pol polyprotein from transposon 17.6 [Trichonephila clavata]